MSQFELVTVLFLLQMWVSGSVSLVVSHLWVCVCVWVNNKSCVREDCGGHLEVSILFAKLRFQLFWNGNTWISYPSFNGHTRFTSSPGIKWKICKQDEVGCRMQERKITHRIPKIHRWFTGVSRARRSESSSSVLYYLYKRAPLALSSNSDCFGVTESCFTIWCCTWSCRLFCTGWIWSWGMV